MAAISINNLKKNYSSVQVLHGVSLDINDGEFLILVGPSGCGKSTLLRMIAGLESISSGDIVLDNEIINLLPPRRRDIAMVFQSYALYPHMTVRKNMAFSLKLARASKAEIAEKVNLAAKVLDLEPLLDRRPSELSGGQRQRVAMGRAIVRNPKLFLFDEPLSNLDAKLRVQMRSEIKQLHQRLQTTTVYVTHDQVEAMTMADRIVVMNAGEIEQVGTPKELYDTPGSQFVATFIGSPSMNMITGKLDSQGNFISDHGTHVQLGMTAPRVSGDTEVVIGIRAEHLAICGDGIELGTANIRVVEPTGSETLLTTSLDDQSLLVLDRERRTMSLDEDISLFALASDIHVFDKATGKRL